MTAMTDDSVAVKMPDTSLFFKINDTGNISSSETRAGHPKRP